jgi:hypothetical protein
VVAGVTDSRHREGLPTQVPLQYQINRIWAVVRRDHAIFDVTPIGGSARIIFVGVRHLASHHRSAVTPAGQVLPCRYPDQERPALSCGPAS